MADGKPILIICPKTSLEGSRWQSSFAFINFKDAANMIAKFTILEITVAMATPITPILNINKNTAFKQRFMKLARIVAANGCFMKPKALRYPAKMGINALRKQHPPTICKY